MTRLALLHGLALVILLTVAVVIDIRERRIPNKVTVPGLLAGLVLGAFLEGGFPLAALSGAGLALLATFPVHAVGGLGAGDVKLFTAVGAFVGAGGLLSVLVYGALAGGLWAIANAFRRGAILGVLVNTMKLILYGMTLGRAGYRVDMNSPEAQAHTVPYGVAIAAGALLAALFPISVGGGP